jgi:hypothetical protein
MAARLSALRACRAIPPGFFIFKDSWYSYIIKIDLRETGRVDVDWIHLAQDKDHWRFFCKHSNKL